MNLLLTTLLQKCGIIATGRGGDIPDVVWEQAEQENVLWNNNRAFQEAKEIYENGSVKANAQLQRAVRKVWGSNPFADLENLTHTHTHRKDR